MFFVNEATFLKSLFKRILNFTYKEKLLVSASLKHHLWGFPGGTVVKNPPASAGDLGLIPSPGRSHVPCVEQLGGCATAPAPRPAPRAPQQRGEAPAPPLESRLHRN